MSPDTPNNAPNSATTSPKPGEAPALTEAAFLQRESARATAAIQQTFKALVGDASAVIDPRTHAREHPFISMGVALAGGFIAASALVPSKKQQVMNELVKLQKSLMPDAAGIPASATKQSSFMSTLLGQAANLAKPILMAALTTPGVSSVQTDEAVSTSNGHMEDPVDVGPHS